MCVFSTGRVKDYMRYAKICEYLVEVAVLFFEVMFSFFKNTTFTIKNNFFDSPVFIQ